MAPATSIAFIKITSNARKSTGSGIKVAEVNETLLQQVCKNINQVEVLLGEISQMLKLGYTPTKEECKFKEVRFYSYCQLGSANRTISFWKQDLLHQILRLRCFQRGLLLGLLGVF